MPDPRTIYLQPWCDECERLSRGGDDGRTWCDHDAWGKCSDCGAKAVRYTTRKKEASDAG